MPEELWLAKRRNVVLAFWATVLFGIPCWYFTTQVSRASLPQLPDFGPVVPVIPIALHGIQTFSAHKVITGLNLLQPVHKFINVSSDPNAYSIEWAAGDSFYSGIKPDTREWHIRSTEAQSQKLEESIMSYMLKILSDEAARIKSFTDKTVSQPDLRVVKYNPSYQIVVSLMNGGGEYPVKSWSIEQSLRKLFEPLISDVEWIADFSLESQIQYHADLTFTPIYDETSGNHVLQKSDLKNFINSAEWNLASARSQSKPLNFIIYVPKPEHRPLVIEDQGVPVPTNSFILPQFGSIIIHNPVVDDESCKIEDDVVDSLVETSIQHFLTLLGMPVIPPAFGEASVWRMDGLIRQRLVETMTSAQETLVSITKVVDQIPNMHVPAHVSTLMQQSLSALSKARDLMEQGRIREALVQSRKAVGKAEEAFFDEKMVSLLYFPDEHKYGVYMPLFGPLLLPLIMAGIRELKAFFLTRKKKRQQKQRQQEQEQRQQKEKSTLDSGQT